MAAKKSKAAGVGAAAWALKDSPAVQRLVSDAELRANLVQAYESTRNAYGRMSNGRPAAKVFDDKKLQKDLSKAAASIRDAGSALREGPKRKKRRFGLGRLLLVTVIGAAVAVGVSEDLRKKVLDALFGAEEEFEYTSATTATTPSEPEPAQTPAPVTPVEQPTTTIIAPAGGPVPPAGGTSEPVTGA